MSIFLRLLLVMLFLIPAEAFAQELDNAEVVVTGNRRSDMDTFVESRPVVGLRRPADFAIISVSVVGDTREMAPRRAEIMAMVKSAVELAPRFDVELATGSEVVEPLTLGNYRNLTFFNDNRPDTDRINFLVKVKLGPGVDGVIARDRMARFIKAVPANGRAEIRGSSADLTLSIVGPDKFRGEILDIVAADAKALTARLGPDYGVEIRGLDRPVEWSGVGLTDVFLYVPYNMVVRPRN